MDTGYIVVINIIYKKIPHLSQKQSSIIKHSWKKNPQKNCCLSTNLSTQTLLTRE